MKVLFVNACIRGAESNTLKLCRTAIEEIQAKFPEATFSEVNLNEERPVPLYQEDVKARSDLHAAERYDAPVFDYAHAFAKADLVLIGAPYWDLMFPSALSVYLERVCAVDVTFRYTPEGQSYSLCKGERILYITTSGSYVEELNLGYDYIKGLNEMFFSFPKIECYKIGGFDLGGDQGLIVEQGKAQLRELIRAW